MTPTPTPSQPAQRYGVWRVVNHSWDETSVYAEGEGDLTICRLNLADWSVTEENQDALAARQAEIATLISAAPDLMAAAKKALNYISNTEGEFGITLDSGDMLRAAIAKAETPNG